MSRARIRRSRAGLIVLLACAAAAFAPSPARAADGRYTQILCANPATGQAVIPWGALPDGMANPSDYPAMSDAVHEARCGDIGIPLDQDVTTTSPHSGAALTYRGGEVRFKSAVIYRSWTGSDAWGLFTNRGEPGYMWTTPSDDRCSSNTFYRCTSRGTTLGRFVDANRVTLTAGTETTNGFNLSLLCDASAGNETCRASAGKGLRFYGGTVTLEDTSPPELSGSLAGELYDDIVAGKALRGVRGLTVAGTDRGAGLYRVLLVVDGVVRHAEVVNENGGQCADAIPGDGDPFQFLTRQPCRAAAGRDIAFDTSGMDEGSHAFKIQLEDAAGNVTTVLNRTVTVDNFDPPAVVTDPALAGSPRRGSSLSVTPATFDDHGAPGDVTVDRSWQRCKVDGTGCVTIAGVTGVSYTLTGDDINRAIRVVETAQNGEGSAVATSVLSPRVTLEDGSLPVDNNGLDDDADGVVDEPGETAPATGPAAPGTGGSSVISTPIRGADGAAGANGRDGLNGGRGVVTTSGNSLGALNGENASPRATLTARFTKGGARGSLAYGKSLVATGRLVDETGRPIRNAIIDIAETAAIAGARAASATPAVTDGDGAFAYKATGKAGSRSVTFVYRYQREGAVVAHMTLALKVKAGVKLAVRLKGIVASYSGKVLAGSMPRGGKLVIVQGRAKGGSWQTFASRRAGKGGKFKGRYRLKVRRPGKKLQFRVRVLSESGWNFGAVTSKAVTRTVK